MGDFSEWLRAEGAEMPGSLEQIVGSKLGAMAGVHPVIYDQRGESPAAAFIDLWVDSCPAAPAPSTVLAAHAPEEFLMAGEGARA